MEMGVVFVNFGLWVGQEKIQKELYMSWVDFLGKEKLRYDILILRQMLGKEKRIIYCVSQEFFNFKYFFWFRGNYVIQG